MLGFASLALALAIACVGLYGTMAYMVSRRTGEIGIRMALGAMRGQIVWMVLREVLVVAPFGVVTGLRAAWGATRLVDSYLFQPAQAFSPAQGRGRQSYDRIIGLQVCP